MLKDVLDILFLSVASIFDKKNNYTGLWNKYCKVEKFGEDF